MDELNELKKKYNKGLERNKKAEEYFKTHTIAECMKYLNLFNEVAIELSLLVIEIETRIYRNMTHKDKINGFKL